MIWPLFAVTTLTFLLISRLSHAKTPVINQYTPPQKNNVNQFLEDNLVDILSSIQDKALEPSIYLDFADYASLHPVYYLQAARFLPNYDYRDGSFEVTQIRIQKQLFLDEEKIYEQLTKRGCSETAKYLSKEIEILHLTRLHSRVFVKSKDENSANLLLIEYRIYLLTLYKTALERSENPSENAFEDLQSFLLKTQATFKQIDFGLISNHLIKTDHSRKPLINFTRIAHVIKAGLQEYSQEIRKYFSHLK